MHATHCTNECAIMSELQDAVVLQNIFWNQLVGNCLCTPHFVTVQTLLGSYRQRYVFWSDVSVRSIMRARLDGSEVTTLVNSGLLFVGKGRRNFAMIIVITL